MPKTEEFRKTDTWMVIEVERLTRLDLLDPPRLLRQGDGGETGNWTIDSVANVIKLFTVVS